MRRMVFAVASQGGQSLVVLTLNVLAARGLSVGAYAAFAMSSAVAMLALGLIRARVLDPWLLLDASRGLRGPVGSWGAHALAGVGGVVVVQLVAGGMSVQSLASATAAAAIVLGDWWRTRLLAARREGALAIADVTSAGIGLGLVFSMVPEPTKLVLCGAGLVVLRGVAVRRVHLKAAEAEPRSADARRLGRGLAADVTLTASAGHLAVLASGAMLSSSAAAGLRGVNVLYGPINVAVLGVLSNMQGRASDSILRAREGTKWISSVGVALFLLSLVYALLLSVADWPRAVLLGPTGAVVGPFLWPIGLQKAVTALSVGPNLMLRASGAITPLVVGRATGSAVTVASLVAALVFRQISVYLWGAVLGAAVSWALMLLASRRLDRSTSLAPSVT